MLSTEDAHQVVLSILKSKSKQEYKELVFCETMIVSEALLQSCLKHFEPVMEKKAQLDIRKGVHLFIPSQQPVTGSGAKSERTSEDVQSSGKGGSGKQDKKDDRRKKASAGGKTGGGTQGRESKSKAVKKKYNARGGRGGDYSDDSGDDNEKSVGNTSQALKVGKPTDQLEFLSEKEVQDNLGQLHEVWGESPPDELLKAIAEHIHRPLTRKYREVAENIFLSSLASGSTRRKLHAELQEKLTTTFANLHLYNKGIMLFKGISLLKRSCEKYLILILCRGCPNTIDKTFAANSLFGVG